MKMKALLTDHTGPRGDLPRRTLVELITRYGPALCDDPRRCEGLLRDFCGVCRLEIHILLAAMKEHVPADLLAQDSLPRQMKLARLTKRLQDNQGVTEIAAVWAVNSWALALGIIPAEEIHDLVPDSPAAAVSQYGISTTPSAGARTATAIPPYPTTTSPMTCPACSRAVAPEDYHCGGCGRVLVLSCPRCGCVTRAEVKHCPKCGLNVQLRRQFEELLREGRKVFQCQAAANSTEPREGGDGVKAALGIFAEAARLVASSGDPELRVALVTARSAAVQAASELAEDACRRDRLDDAARYLRCLLEAEADHTSATERLRAITAKRDELLGGARAALKSGQPKSAVKILECASRMFSQDAEIAALLDQCRQQVRELTELIGERVPVLTRERKFCELGRLIASLEASGVHVQGIERYKSVLEKKLQSVVPMIRAAEQSFAQGDYQQAIGHCGAVLMVVADHEDALRIETAARRTWENLCTEAQAVRAAIQSERWFEARRLLRPLEEVRTANERDVQRLRACVDAAVERIGNYWRLVTMVISGGAVWLVTGWLALVFGNGIGRVLGRSPLDGGDDLWFAWTWGGQMLFAGLVLPFLAAILVGPRVLRVTALLVVIAIAGALLLGSGIWLTGPELTQLLSWKPFLRVGLYAAVAALLLAMLAKGLLRTLHEMNFVAPMAVAALVSVVIGSISAVPPVFRPEALQPNVLAAILFWSFVVVTGLCRSRMYFLLLLPIAVLLAYGLELGGGLAWNPAWWILVRGVLLAIAVLSTQAQSLRWPKAIGILAAGYAMALTAVLLTCVNTAPSLPVLLAVWCSAWGTLAALSHESLLPSFRIVDWYRLRRANTRPAENGSRSGPVAHLTP